MWLEILLRVLIFHGVINNQLGGIFVRLVDYRIAHKYRHKHKIFF